jgi:hypothetical protein
VSFKNDWAMAIQFKRVFESLWRFVYSVQILGVTSLCTPS